MFLPGSIAAFLAYFVKGLSGFANTLVFTSILSFFTANRNITPVDLLLGLPSNAYIVWRQRAHIRARIVLPLIGMLAVGMVPGTLLLGAGDDRLIKILLGISLILLAINMIWQARRPATTSMNRWVLLGIGVLSGFLCGLFGIGAFLVAYINRTTSSNDALKGNLCCVFLAENALRIALYLAQGLLTTQVLLTTATLLPGMALGLLAGLKLSTRLPEKWVTAAIHILLIIMGLALVLRNL